jgi:cytochrome c peroxidase
VGSNAQATAVAFDGSDRLIVQTREPAALWFMGQGETTPTAVTLSSTSRADLAHAIFHTLAGAAIACASCHPEGGDDGHVWMLDGELRRTPSLRGTIAGTAPYHWPGDLPDFTSLVNEVYTQRMAGAVLGPWPLDRLQKWVEAIPAPPAPSWLDAAAVQRGQAIFQRSDVGCTSCHSGAKFTNNATMFVGTGASFQVPPLVGVSWRTPLLHDGCAATIADRFGKCATAGHGSIGSLSAEDISDLVAYLESI